MNIKNQYVVQFYLFTLIVCTLGFAGCENFSGQKIKEGTITYAINYLDDPKENAIINILPATATYYFKEDKTALQLTGFMGLFSIRQIINRKEKKSFILLNIGDQNYVTEDSKFGGGYDNMNSLKYTKVDGHKLIVGQDCKQYIASCKEVCQGDFPVFYTNSIKVKNPNIFSPYKDIDGVLLNFRAKFSGIKISLLATKITKEKLNDNIFELPKVYKKVTKEELLAVIKSFTNPDTQK